MAETSRSPSVRCSITSFPLAVEASCQDGRHEPAGHRRERLRLRPLDAQDLDRLAEIVGAPGVSEWWSPPDTPEAVREDLRNEGAAFGIEVDGDLVGWLAFNDETDRDWQAVGIDIFLAPSHQGRGLGPEACERRGWLAAERGRQRFTIDPAVATSGLSPRTRRSGSAQWV